MTRSSFVAIAMVCVIGLTVSFVRGGTIPDDLDYKVVEQHRGPGAKLSLHVELSRKVSEDTLRAIAMRLKSDEPAQYDRIFITYSLPGMTLGAGAWATTHFNPTLKVEILGLTEEEASSLAGDKTEPKGTQVIGMRHPIKHKN